MVTEKNREELDRLRHSAAHLLAAAVLKLWPDTKLAIGPAIEDGFYYDFEFSEPISEKDLPKIEKQMKKLLPDWTEFTHREVSALEARQHFKGNSYKLEIIDEIEEKGGKITLYTSGEFTDLCRGGHVDRPREAIKYFKLLSLAGAYWRGDEHNTMLTRIYGTAFPAQKDLETHLVMLEEAKKRDHRKLGRDLDLFTFSPLVGPGLPLFTPRGTVIRNELEQFLRSLQEPRGYQQVTIPHLAKGDLYKTSGHWDKFQDKLFFVRGREDEFVIKPMNCPHHTQIYAARPRSYRDLPLRLAETTTIYRDEKPGELLGLSRVRSITQDDAHVFCTAEQLPEEIATVLALVKDFYAAFDFELETHLSLRDPATPDRYLGDDALWDMAETQLAAVLDKAAMEYVRDEGEAAFYGPKIDFVARDSLHRRWQLATIQLDFTMPERFSLTYTDQDGGQQTPVMIHRAITGSLERFMAILLEHYAGALPLWLSPIQVAVLPISDDQNDYAQSVVAQMKEAGLRVEVDDRSESVGKKIREAELMKVPIMLIVGKKEAEAKEVSVRSRDEGDEGPRSIEGLVQELVKRVAKRA